MRHEGGSLTAKPMPPRSYEIERARAEEERRLMEEMQAQRAYEERLAQIMEIERRDAIPDAIPERLEPLPPEPMESQYADKLNAAMQRYRRERGLMELGNRQRAAAATARTRSNRGPSRAQAARNQAEYDRAMRARQEMRSRVNDPSPSRGLSRHEAMMRVGNRQRQMAAQQAAARNARPRPVTPPTSINRGNGIASPAIRPPNYRPPVRPNPAPRPQVTPTNLRQPSTTLRQMGQGQPNFNAMPSAKQRADYERMVTEMMSQRNTRKR
tara:strand:+ start:117 stop:923 length:807 start_codon:yes stop_codon:yes gene_type:complete